MTLNKRKSGQQIDHVLMIILLILIGVGFLVKIQATSVTEIGQLDLLDFQSLIGKQLIWTIVCAIILLSILVIEPTFWSVFAFIIYGSSIVLLLLVLVIGVEINGARSWFSIGGFSFQPSEIAKFGTALAISHLLANPKINISDFKPAVLAVGVIALPMLLILLQSDAGSAMVFLALTFALYREGLPAWPIYTLLFLSAIFLLTLLFGTMSTMLIFLLLGLLIMMSDFEPRQYWLGAWALLAIVNYVLTANGLSAWALLPDALMLIILLGYYFQRARMREAGIIVSAGLIAWGLSLMTSYMFNNLLKPHWRDRLNAWLHPDKCDWDTIYNVVLSKMSISSGGLRGKGFLEGSLTKFNFVPEHTTDFIYCVVGEEYGFAGAFLLMALFFALIVRIIQVAELQKLKFNRSYFYCVAGIIFFHVLINIGMTLGLMPVVGIPLPFISYGGSSLIGFTLLLGVLIRIDYRKSG